MTKNLVYSGFSAFFIFCLSSCQVEPPDANEDGPPGRPYREMNSHLPEDPKLVRQRSELFETLRSLPYHIQDEKVLASMESVPRELFVPEAHQKSAYINRPLPIGWNQTISQPYIVALMTEKLQTDPEDRVLEIGTGCGYQAAVLSPLVKEVYSIEIVEPLAEQAKERLELLGYSNVITKHGDGYLGWEEKAPFDAIIVTCAPTEIPDPLVAQLRDNGGRMIIPVGEAGNQRLFLLEKRNGKVSQKAVLPVAFVPMTR